MGDIASADRFMERLPVPEVHRVGGSVRDELLGRAAKDADYVVRGTELYALECMVRATSADVSPLRLREEGPQVGVRVTIGGQCIEVCLPRTEASTGGGRHDFEMAVDSTLPLEADAMRRDFTINALYRDVRNPKQVVDPLGGLTDLHGRLIRTTHPSSFRDDPLRTLRALRFVSTLGFELALMTYLEMKEHADAVTGLTQKGVSSTALDELSRLLLGRRPARALRVARDTGVLRVLLPELEAMIGFEQGSRYHSKTVDEHTFDAVQAAADADAQLRVRMALLFHDSGKPAAAWIDENGDTHYYAQKGGRAHEEIGAELAEQAMWRLNASRPLRQDVHRLVERHMLPLSRPKRIRVHTLRAELGDSLLGDLTLHRRCDVLGKGGDTTGALAALSRFEELHRYAKHSRVPRAVDELPIGGGELLNLGLKGRAVGEVQRQLLHEVMAQPDLNVREWLVRRAGALARKAA